MKKKNNKHGFTLAELLIVVAIIAVLTAIAIPVFSNQLKKAELATDVANVRADMAEKIATALADGTLDASGKMEVTLTYVPKKCNLSGGTDYGADVVVTHAKDSSLTQSLPVDDDVKVLFTATAPAGD